MMNPFRKYGAYPEMKPGHFNAAPLGYPMYSYPNLGLTNNDAYCDY